MRDDSLGFFWEDVALGRSRSNYARPIPAIPDTGWLPPKEFPRLVDVDTLAIDVETRDIALSTKGPGFRREGDEHANIVGLAVGTSDGGRWYFPMRHTIAAEQNLDPDSVLQWARDNLCTPNQTKIGANIMYDVDALWSEGVPVTGPFVDVQFAEALIDENRFSYSLENLLRDYFNEGKVKDELREWCIRAYGDENYRQNIWRAPPCLVGPYAEGDVDGPLRLYERQQYKLADEDLQGLFDLECNLIEPLVHMRQRGVRVDIEYAKRLDDELTQAIALIDAQLKAIAGRDINTAAANDLQRLFDKAGALYPRTPTGKPSFAKAFLEHCDHPAALLIVERRKLAKYRDTFVRGYVLNLHVNGRLHALFHPLKGDENGAVSGRFSSSLPNLQNIPIRDPVWGPKLRALFLADDGEEWLRHDWSQIEYRFLAHYARGPTGRSVRERYRNDPKTDFHEMTLDMVAPVAGWDVGSLEMRKQYRKPIKNINFGLCIAEGQRVLTDRGLVPIEAVQPSDKLWDGVEWVQHSGVVCNGSKKVINYGGLTATPEHIVWTLEGWAICLGVAASKGIELVRSGTSDGCPVTTGDASPYQWIDSSEKFETLWDATMRCLRSTKDAAARQLQGVSQLHLPERQVPGQTGESVGSPIRCDDPTLQSRHSCIEPALQGSWDQGIVQVQRALHQMGSEKMARAVLQRIGLRSSRQRWRLLTGKSSSSASLRQSDEQATVYDIIDAGPRNRFTCEGVLVHNCYGMGEKKLTRDLDLTTEQGSELFSSYHHAVPFVKDTYNAAQDLARERGWLKLIDNRRARFPLWEPRWRREGDERPALRRAEAEAIYGAANLTRAYTHKALNRLLQGSAAGLMKKAMLDMWKAGLHNVLGHMLITCHDETGHSKPRTPAGDEAAAEVKHIMEHCMPLTVPVYAEQSIGASWGACK